MFRCSSSARCVCKELNLGFGRSDDCAIFLAPRNKLWFSPQAFSDGVFVQDLSGRCWCFSWCSHSRLQFCIPSLISCECKVLQVKVWKIYCPDRDRHVGISMSLRWEDWRSRFSKNEHRNSSQNHVVVVSPHLNFQTFGSVVLHVLRWSHAVSARQQGLICRWENRHFGQVELALISNLCASCRNAGEQCWCNHGVLALTCSKLFILLHIAIIQHTYVTHVLEKLWLA